MESLRKWIKEHGTIKQFLIGTKISRSFFYEWEVGKKRFSLQTASRIVKYTNESISYEDLANFEINFENSHSKALEKDAKSPPPRSSQRPKHAGGSAGSF